MKRLALFIAVILTTVCTATPNPAHNGQCSMLNAQCSIINPLIFADFPDPDVIRVGNTYYMVSTTMHHFPGATILKSNDLINWEYCSQPLTQLSNADNYNLINGHNAYARGMWACSMKYHNGMFYLLINGNDTGGWLLTANDPEGEWHMRHLSRIYYDPGMLFDNGKVYVACGIGNIQMCELDEDFNYIREQRVVSDKQGLEGCHLYKIGEYYYIYATYGGWPSGQTVFRSKNIFGPYEEKLLVDKTIDGRPNTIHQGALFNTPTGEWWTIMQQDLGCLGRMPNLQPVTWHDGWPMVDIVIKNEPQPEMVNAESIANRSKLGRGVSKEPGGSLAAGADIGGESVSGNAQCSMLNTQSPLPTNDDFTERTLGMQWQWNHNPDNKAWSLTERPGWLRLKTCSTTDRLTQARNTLTQRIFVYRDSVTGKPLTSCGTVRIDASQLQEGDRAGICILQDPYALIAVEISNGAKRLVWQQDQLTTNRNFTPALQTETAPIDSIVYLRATVSYATSRTQFYYSLDDKVYNPIGQQTTLGFNLSVFVGARFGLFCYSNGQSTTGYADFDWFSTDTY